MSIIPSLRFRKAELSDIPNLAEGLAQSFSLPNGKTIAEIIFNCSREELLEKFIEILAIETPGHEFYYGNYFIAEKGKTIACIVCGWKEPTDNSSNLKRNRLLIHSFRKSITPKIAADLEKIASLDAERKKGVFCIECAYVWPEFQGEKILYVLTAYMLRAYRKIDPSIHTMQSNMINPRPRMARIFRLVGYSFKTEIRLTDEKLRKRLGMDSLYVWTQDISSFIKKFIPEEINPSPYIVPVERDQIQYVVASEEDIPNLAEHILTSYSINEKTLYEIIFQVSKSELKKFIISWLEKNQMHNPFSIKQYLLAKYNDEIISVCCGWKEGSDGSNSHLIVNKFISDSINHLKFEQNQTLIEQAEELNIMRKSGFLYLENACTLPKYRRFNVAYELVYKLVKQRKEQYPELEMIHSHVYLANKTMYNMFQRFGYKIEFVKKQSDNELKKLFPVEGIALVSIPISAYFEFFENKIQQLN